MGLSSSSLDWAAAIVVAVRSFVRSSLLFPLPASTNSLRGRTVLYCTPLSPRHPVEMPMLCFRRVPCLSQEERRGEEVKGGLAWPIFFLSFFLWQAGTTLNTLYHTLSHPHHATPHPLCCLLNLESKSMFWRGDCTGVQQDRYQTLDRLVGGMVRAETKGKRRQQNRREQGRCYVFRLGFSGLTASHHITSQYITSRRQTKIQQASGWSSSAMSKISHHIRKVGCRDNRSLSLQHACT